MPRRVARGVGLLRAAAESDFGCSTWLERDVYSTRRCSATAAAATTTTALIPEPESDIIPSSAFGFLCGRPEVTDTAGEAAAKLAAGAGAGAVGVDVHAAAAAAPESQQAALERSGRVDDRRADPRTGIRHHPVERFRLLVRSPRGDPGAVGVDVHAAAAAAPESQQAALERSERDKAALEKKRRPHPHPHPQRVWQPFSAARPC
jgi:hypothetical protein